ncbi:hypothetical protein FRB94_011399 [Tulasnella sp. JGI-2019a]|nr:hypothetical protein FRB94_011399 [Tulasnella sp. JGI-2019a]KAG9002064.1 hypothetical protein FRB93_011835 [Tulasnella sp. JGI-2019a]
MRTLSLATLALVAIAFALPVLDTQESAPASLARRAPMQDSMEELEDITDQMKAVIAQSEALENAYTGWRVNNPDKELMRSSKEMIRDAERAMVAGKDVKGKVEALIKDCEAFDQALNKWHSEFNVEGKASSPASLERLSKLDMVTNTVLPRFDDLAEARAEFEKHAMGGALNLQKFEGQRETFERTREWLRGMIESPKELED